MDIIREIRLRRWARAHWVAPARRSAAWHPIVLEEMLVRDADLEARVASETVDSGTPESTIAATELVADRCDTDRCDADKGDAKSILDPPFSVPELVAEREAAPSPPAGYGYVPLMPEPWIVHPPHGRLADPKLLRRIESLEAEACRTS